MSLRIKFLEFSKKLVAILPVIILKLAIVLEDIIMSSSNFPNGKIANRHFWQKKDLGKLDMKEVDLPEGIQIFIKQNLCPYYKSLWSKSKKLSSLGKIHSFFISGSTIKIKLQENSNPESITHSSDFDKFFPDVDLSPSN